MVTTTAETNKEERRVVTLDEAAVLLRISRGSAYQAAKSREIPTIRIGRRLLVPLAALERMLAGDTGAATARSR
jgi:excisionase family DNA binding protein